MFIIKELSAKVDQNQDKINKKAGNEKLGILKPALNYSFSCHKKFLYVSFTQKYKQGFDINKNI